ncbi:helix-turn-helix transcriptional regulator [Flavobacterium beibuense]|uniref:helix-turn-helix transcriptional regulator n=1 Tax=Flavobacterium beibuense TaxID=657326 RepID=UPI003A8FE581
MTNINIPSGLIDENIELFSVDGEPMAVHQGRAKYLFDLPIEILNVIEADIIDNPAADRALELAGYNTRAAKIKKYTVCRFGNFDNTPDFKDGRLQNSEYYNCGYRGSCTMEGIVCNSLWVNGRVISPLEIKMIEWLATDLTIPAVADKVSLSVTTFELRKKVLFEKLKVQTRAKMVAEAYKLQILTPCSS